MNANFLIFLILGLQSTLHCVTMCGPLALAAPINKSKTSKAIIGSLSYHIGRISSYTYLGFVISLLGLQTSLLFTFQWISMLTGFVMLATVFIGSIETWPIFSFVTARIGSITSNFFPKIKQAPAYSQAFLFGLLNGFLPCGMVYIGLLYSLSAPSNIDGILGMLFFGIGTLPVMFFVPLIGQKKLLTRLPRYAHKVLLCIIASLLIIRGLGLGIPYLSPVIKAPTKAHQQPSIQCCEVQ